MPKLSLTSLEVCVGEQKLDDKHLFSSWLNSLKELFQFLFGEGDFIQTFLLWPLPHYQKQLLTKNMLILKIKGQNQIKVGYFVVKLWCDKPYFLVAEKGLCPGHFRWSGCAPQPWCFWGALGSPGSCSWPLIAISPLPTLCPHPPWCQGRCLGNACCCQNNLSLGDPWLQKPGGIVNCLGGLRWFPGCRGMLFFEAYIWGSRAQGAKVSNHMTIWPVWVFFLQGPG